MAETDSGFSLSVLRVCSESHLCVFWGFSCIVPVSSRSGGAGGDGRDRPVSILSRARTASDSEILEENPFFLEEMQSILTIFPGESAFSRKNSQNHRENPLRNCAETIQ